ncbi:hypothetical protein A3D06_00345 [Candidatus Roizmanbacteria bacterium RIFCSPHIGHO2_02_FULL_40_9]|uniref:Cysteine desulfurase n=2 Tax=Candidatus Roizmaniibacteriota TaxID=1752723 RepID=A0A1F7HDT2_9BACT|nr:MAG: hypothetical protein A3D06_00345 [Candidatus Roizmanbacteria bacterium RIFCSPHIGHO2_02_FULL_40_9]
MKDIQSIRKDFPIFSHDPSLVYLDSTATSLKPQCVIDALTEYYARYSANVHRGIYDMSEKATLEYESARERVKDFINAQYSEEVIFVRNTTEAMNLIAYALGRKIVSEGDEIVTTIAEHHSNFVPWQQLAFENGAIFKVIQVMPEYDYKLHPEHISQVITRKTKMVALTYISNVLGVINPVRDITKAIRRANPETIIILDAAQASPHIQLDVQHLGVDFIAFSGHKMCGPTGIGVLWGRKELLKKMNPFMFGGNMIKKVSLNFTTYNDVPYLFEAGTPHIAGAIGLKAAIQYLETLNLKEIELYEYQLAKYAINELKKAFGDKIRFIGPTNSPNKIGICAFTFLDYHPHDVAQILSDEGVSVRAGHHCAMPLHESLGLEASIRASFYIYNTEEDVEKLIKSLKKVEQIFHVNL